MWKNYRHRLLEFLWLEDEVEESAEEAHHGEGSSNERADGGDELVPMLALPADHHRHGRDVVAEAGLRNIFLRVLNTIDIECTYVQYVDHKI